MTKLREFDIVALGLSFLAVFVVGAFGSLFEAGHWYDNLVQPEFTPPSWLFPVAWTTLYILMAIAAWLVFRRAGGFRQAFVPLLLYGVHLLFNAAWSGIFFGLHLMDLALLDLAILLLLAIAVTFQFIRVSRPAGFLLIPYLLWLCFAFWLNLRFWQLNPNEAVLT